MKPLLAAPADLEKIRYPVMVSPKVDGIRCLIKDGQALSRSLKPIPNHHVQSLAQHWPNGLDGELIVGSAVDKGAYNRTQSAVMSKEGVPDVIYLTFDRWDMDEEPFHSRFEAAQPRKEWGTGALNIVAVHHTQINSEEELLNYETHALALGYEGVMIRDPNGKYKFGRSTVNQGILLKLKRFEDSEAVILHATELMHNGNRATTNALGHTERSHRQENLVPMGTLGNLVVTDMKTGVEFEIGTGFTAHQRQHLWDNIDHYIGNVVKYKYLAHGMKDRPRHPVFLGFRDERDM